MREVEYLGDVIEQGALPSDLGSMLTRMVTLLLRWALA